MDGIGESALIVLTVPVWWAWLRGLARLVLLSLLPVTGAILAPFLLLACGSVLDELFGWERGSGGAVLFLSVPLVLVGWIGVAVVRSAWRELRRGWGF